MADLWDDADRPLSPTPHLQPILYWPSRRVGEPDVGWFKTPENALRVQGWLFLVAGALPLVIGLVGFIIGERGFWWGLIGPVLIVFSGASTIRKSYRTSYPPMGVWTVDEQGYPTAFVAAKRDADLSRKTGVSYDVFLESVKLRSVSAAAPSR